MKKIIILPALLFVSFQLFGQDVRFGLRTAPNIAYNRVFESENEDFFNNREPNSFGVRFSGGVVSDIFFHDNYALSTGFWYTVKRASISISGVRPDAHTNIQYAQLPITMKFFTNEVADGLKVYFQLGFTADFKLAEKYKEYGKRQNDNNEIPESKVKNLDSSFTLKAPEKELYTFFDFGAYVGSGVEYELGDIATIFGGLSYNRGLLNISQEGAGEGQYSYNFQTNGLEINTDLISVEAGIIFKPL